MVTDAGVQVGGKGRLGQRRRMREHGELPGAGRRTAGGQPAAAARGHQDLPGTASPPYPTATGGWCTSPSGLAVNEYGVAADLFCERTAGAENHGDALRVPGRWRTQLARHGEQPAASVV